MSATAIARRVRYVTPGADSQRLVATAVAQLRARHPELRQGRAPTPAEFMAIAEREGITVLTRPLGAWHRGMATVVFGDRYIVLADDLTPPAWVTIAIHELAHHVLHLTDFGNARRARMGRRYGTAIATAVVEHEADQVAIALGAERHALRTRDEACLDDAA